MTTGAGADQTDHTATQGLAGVLLLAPRKTTIWTIPGVDHDAPIDGSPIASTIC